VGSNPTSGSSNRKNALTLSQNCVFVLTEKRFFICDLHQGQIPRREDIVRTSIISVTAILCLSFANSAVGQGEQAKPENPPALTEIGDDCSDPIMIRVPADLPYYDLNQTTCGRENDYYNTCLGYYDGNEDIVYQVEATESNWYDFTVEIADMGHCGFALSSTCPPLNCLFIVQIPEAGAWTGTAYLDIGTYYLIVDSHSQNSCIADFDLTIAVGEEPAVPENDDCVDAEPIEDGLYQPFSTIYATASGLGNCMESPDIWYVYTSACNANVTVDLLGSGFATQLAVYDGNTCDPLPAEIECNDFFYSFWTSRITFEAVEGSQYLIQVGGYAGLSGNGLISVEGCLCPELCQQPTPPDQRWGSNASDIELYKIRYDNYPEIAQICRVQFWGLVSHLEPDANWSDCEEDPIDFRIMFYPEDEETGEPDVSNPTCSYDFTLEGRDTGIFYRGWDELVEYNALLYPCCDLSEGWVSIQAMGPAGDSCLFSWFWSSIGDDFSYYQQYGYPERRIIDVSRCLFDAYSDCQYVASDCNHNGVPLELGDVVTMIGMYRGTGEVPYACGCPPHGFDFSPEADPNGNCVALELGDVVTEIGAYRGTTEASGCPDCPGSLRLIPDDIDRPIEIPRLKHRVTKNATPVSE
jgi:hypothetical protein